MIKIFSLLLAAAGFCSSSLLMKASDLAEMQAKQRLAVQAWIAGYEFATNAGHDKKDSVYENIFAYRSATNGEKKRLAKKYPKLRRLVDFLEPNKVTSTEAIEKQRQELREAAWKSPEEVRRIVNALHKEDSNLSNDVLDNLFGFEYESLEPNIQFKRYKYFLAAGAPKANTQSTYETIRSFLRDYPPQSGQTVYDLGSGYGRVVLYGCLVFPETKFKGIEIEKERALGSAALVKKLKVKNAEIIHGDVLEEDISDGDYFYIFNSFPTIMDQVMGRLEKIAKKKKITVVTTGRTSKDISATPWLKVAKTYGENERALTVYVSTY